MIDWSTFDHIEFFYYESEDYKPLWISVINDKEETCLEKDGNSMEQLWLAFVMHEKYGKKWDGKEWHFFTKT